MYMNILPSSCSEREVTLSSLTSADCLRFFPHSTRIQARLVTSFQTTHLVVLVLPGNIDVHS